MSCRVFKSRKWREERKKERGGVERGRRRAISFSFSFRMDDVGRGPFARDRGRSVGRSVGRRGEMSSATYLTGFLRLSRSPNPAVKVGKKVRGRERIEVVAAVGSLLHAYLRISSVIGARARSFPKSLTSSHFLFINGNGEKRACVRRSEGGRRKNFLEEVEDNHLRFVGGPTLPTPARLFFGAKKAKKWGNPIRFLPPSLFFLRFSLTLSLSLYLSLSRPPFLFFLYGQIRLPAVGIITDWEGGGGVGCCFWLFCFGSE